MGQSPKATNIKAQGEGFAEPWGIMADTAPTLKASNNGARMFVPFRDGNIRNRCGSVGAYGVETTATIIKSLRDK